MITITFGVALGILLAAWILFIGEYLYEKYKYLKIKRKVPIWENIKKFN